MVLVASGTDSLLDVVVSVFNLFALKESKKPADQEHNYGHGKIEGIAGLFEGTLILGSGAFIIISSIKKIIAWTGIEKIEQGIWIMIISIIITIIIIIILQKTKEKTDNLVVSSDLVHYKMDLLTNISVIFSLLVIQQTWWTLIDPIVGILIALYISKESRNILSKSFQLLMDSSLGKDQEIAEIILQHEEVKSFHKLKTHQSGSKADITFHLVFKNPEITLKEAHNISKEIEQNLKRAIKNATVTIKWEPCNKN